MILTRKYVPKIEWRQLTKFRGGNKFFKIKGDNFVVFQDFQSKVPKKTFFNENTEKKSFFKILGGEISVGLNATLPPSLIDATVRIENWMKLITLLLNHKKKILVYGRSPEYYSETWR